MPPVIRIVPKVSTRGWAAAAFALGAVCTAAAVAVPWRQLVNATGNVGMALEALADLSGVLLPPMLLALLVLRQTPRWRPALLIPAAWMAGLSVGGFAGTALTAPLSVASEVVRQGAGYLLPLPLFAVLGIALAALARWIGGYIRRPVVQSGTHCWRCSHNAGMFTTCPECASPMDAERFRRRRLFALGRLAGRVGRPLAVLVLIAVGAISVHMMLKDGLPIHRFTRAMGQEKGDLAPWLYISPTMETGFEWDGLLVTRPVQELGLPPTPATDRLRGLRIGYAYWVRGPAGGPPQMRMRVFLGTFCTAAGWERVVDEGTVRICSDLNEAQAQQVIAAGRAPDSLVLAMLDAAQREAWAPQPNAYGANYFAKHVEIDPEEHFPRDSGRTPPR